MALWKNRMKFLCPAIELPDIFRYFHGIFFTVYCGEISYDNIFTRQNFLVLLLTFVALNKMMVSDSNFLWTKIEKWTEMQSKFHFIFPPVRVTVAARDTTPLIEVWNGTEVLNLLAQRMFCLAQQNTVYGSSRRCW